MAGLLELAQVDKNNALAGFRQASQLEARRDNNNEQLQMQADAQRKQAVGTAIGTGASVAMAAGGPAGLAVGGLMLLGSLF